MKTGKNFVRFALVLALVISMVAALNVAAFAIPANEPSGYADGGNMVYSQTATGGSVSAKVGNKGETGGGILEDVVYGTTVTVTVVPETGYKFSSLSVKDTNGNNVAVAAGTEANTYTFVMPETSATVTATFEKLSAELDSTNSTKTVDQNYTLTVSGGSYTDVTKVKVEWTTTDISATRTDNKTWNPDTLTWDATTDTNTVTVSQNGGATFTLTNLSSVRVSAAVTFAQASTFTAPEVAFTVDSTAADDGAATIGTVVGSDYSVDTTTDHDTVIGVTVTPVASDFKALAAATNAQYGTYTVTISTVS